MIEGTKDRIPAMSDAVLKFINKYHTDHFGFDLKHGGMKLKNTVSSGIERAYHEVPMSFNKLQNSLEHLGDHGKDMYRKASDSLMSMKMQTVIDSFALNAGEILKYGENKIYAIIDAVVQFFSDTKFTMPGTKERISSSEFFRRARRAVSRAVGRAVQRFVGLMEKIYSYIREVEFSIPGTEVIVNGNKILNKVKSSMRFIYDQLKLSVSWALDLLHKTVNGLLQMIAERGDNVIIYLQDENMRIASEVDAIHAEILQSSKQHIEEAKICVAKYKDFPKLKIQEAYYALNMERVNNNTKEVISILQSHLYGGLSEFVDLIRRTSQSTAPYIKLSETKMDIEIPLPFFWKSFNEWPKQSRL